MSEPTPTDPHLTREHVPALDSTDSFPTRPPVSADGESETLPPAAPASASGSAAAGVSVPGYEILGKLGEGGMGVVYKARQLAADRDVALKMILGGGHVSADLLTRFRTEAKAIARLQHPNIVQVHEVGECDGLPYFSLEFCPGGSLDKKLAGTPLPPLEAARMVETLARAMHAAHQQQIIHRDLKPANVLLAADGTLKITDFGLAKKLDAGDGPTQSNAVMGTPSYMAPEQAGSKGTVGPAADVYALGAILYECLVGRPPFKAASVLDTLMQVLSDEPVSPGQLQTKTPRDLETVCLKCLQKDPAKRYASAEALAEDLRRFVEGHPIVARPVGRLERAAKWVRRNPALAAMTAAVVLVLVTATAISTGFGWHARQQAADAISARNDLASANENLKKTANDLQSTAADLRQSRDDLETMLARSLLRPLSTEGGAQPMTEPEWEALWELAANRHGNLGYRFVEEALRSRLTTRQLRDRSSFAFHAAVGLDLRLRDKLEALLEARLDDPALEDQQKTDLALAASRWDGLRSPCAARVSRQLARVALSESPSAYEAVKALSVVASRLEPNDAATHAATLVQAYKDAKDPYVGTVLPQALSAVAARMQPSDAAKQAATLVQALKVAKDPHVQSWLAEGLSAVAARLQPSDAAPFAADPAASFVQVLKDPKNLISMNDSARGLSRMAPFLEPKDAAALARTLVQALKESKNPTALFWQAQGLLVVVPRLEPKDAVMHAGTLVQALKDVKDPVAQCLLAQGLSVVASHLEPKDAAPFAIDAAATLVQALKDAKEPIALEWLARGLSVVVPRLQPSDAAPFAADAAATLVQSLKDAKDNYDRSSSAKALLEVASYLQPSDVARHTATLVEALEDPTRRNVVRDRAQGLSAVARRLEPSDAAKQAAILVQALKNAKDPNAQHALAQSLSAVASRLQPSDAAPFAADAAATLVQALKNPTDNNALSLQAKGLSEVASHLQPSDAATHAATLMQALKDAKEPITQLWLTQSLAIVASRLQPSDAAPFTAYAATTLLQVIKDAKDPKDPNAQLRFAEGLSTVASGLQPKESEEAAALLIQLRSRWNNESNVSFLSEPLSAVIGNSHHARRAEAVTATIGCLHDSQGLLNGVPLLRPTAELFARRFSDQDLVELLKHPLCVGAARRAVLDELGIQHRHYFADQWEFVEYAEKHLPDIDLKSPPKRPQP
jgi:hypothetical protein